MAILMKTGGGVYSPNGSNPTQSDKTADSHLNTALAAYRKTYGQYEIGGSVF
jgi:hypothetical protein